MLATSAWQVQSSGENWGPAPPPWHAPKTNIYQRSFYGPKYEAQTASATAERLQNDIGNGLNIPRNWNIPKSNLNPRPFYGARQELQTPAKAVQPKNSYGNKQNIPRNWNTPKSNLYPRPFYGARQELPTPAKVVQPKNSYGNRHNIPQNWNTAKSNIYQSPLYGPRHGVQTATAAMRLQSSIGNRNNIPRHWKVLKISVNQRPFYGSGYKTRKTTSAFQLQNGIGNSYNVPRNRNVPRISHYQGPFYGSMYKVHTTATLVQPPHGVGYGSTVSRKWNTANTNPNQKPFYGSSYKVGKTTSASQRQNRISNSYQNPFYGPKHKVQTAATAAQLQNSVGNGRNFARYWNGPNRNVQRKLFYGTNHNSVKANPPSRLQNGIGSRRNVPRNWIPFGGNLYQIPLYSTKHEAGKTQSPEGPVMMHSSVENTALGRSITPLISKWLSTVQRNRISQTEEIRSPVRALITTPGVDSRTAGFSESPLSSNYQLEEYTMGQKLEPVPTQSTSDVSSSADVALQTVLSNVNPSENSLIPESVSNQRATSRTGYKATALEEEQMPVPRKSYVTTSYIRKESRLNDPKLIKLRQILPNLKKRSLNQTTDEDANPFNHSIPRAGARRRVLNVTRSFKKRNLENSREKKSSIRKVKGRQIWSILNEFTPNVRLATMTLLKQKRQNVRERELKRFGPKVENKNWDNAPVLNGGLQNVSSSTKQKEKEAAPSSLRKHSVFLKRHRAKSQGGPKRHIKKNTRNFINGRSNAFYVSPNRAYLNRNLSPFYERNFEPYFNNRGQFEAAQIGMAERMGAMRSRGLFHSLGNINPQFFSQNPYRYPTMPMPQQFEAIQPYRLPARNVPFENSRAPFTQMQNYFSAPWNMRLANRVRRIQAEDEESNNFGTLPQGSYNQESMQPNIEENKSSDTALPGDSGKFTDSYQSPLTESSSQILKIDNNKLLEGHPMVNSENDYANTDQGVYGKTNPRLTGMQVTDQLATMLNKWYPVRTGKVSLMTDPRKVSSQWPSGLPGLDVATKFNPLQARGYSAVNNPAMVNRFYQDNEENFQPNEAAAEEENADDVPSNWNNIESNNFAFNRGNRIPFPALMMMKRAGMNGIANEGYFPNPGPYPEFQFPFLPSFGRGLVLRKRDVRQANNSLQVPRGKNKMVDAKNMSNNSSSKTSRTPVNESHGINKVKNAEKTHLSNTKSHNKKTVIREHSSRIRRKFRSPRNSVNVGSSPVDAGIPSFLPFYGDTSDPRMRLMDPQLPVEDPIIDMKRKGYKLASGTFRASFPALPRWWTNAAAGLPSSTSRDQELSFPVGPPQSLMELSQKVDQFPAHGFALSERDMSPETQREDSNVEPNTVSSALNILSSQEPHESSELPSMRKPRNGRNAEDESEQTFLTSPPFYSFRMGGVPQSFQGPPNVGVPEFPEQSSSEFSEGPQGIPENVLQENGEGFTGGGQIYSQEDDASNNGAEDENGETESVLTPGLMDGLDVVQASLLKEHMGNLAPMKRLGSMGYFNAFRPSQKGNKRPLPVNHLSPPERNKAPLRQNAMAGRKIQGVLQQRATFSTKQNIQGNTQGNILSGTASGRNSHMLSLPNLSLNTIEKLINSAGGEQSKGDYNTAAVHGYGSNSKSPTGNKLTDEISGDQDSSEQNSASEWNEHNSLNGNGKFVHNFDWKSPLISQSQSPSDFNWKLERALTEWKEPPNTNHDSANSGGTLPENTPEKVFVPPKGSNGNPDVVPGYTFDTQGQRSGPLFLPNPPPELGDDSSAETVLMVPSSGDKSKGETGAKKENINKKVKTSQKEQKL